MDRKAGGNPVQIPALRRRIGGLAAALALQAAFLLLLIWSLPGIGPGNPSPRETILHLLERRPPPPSVIDARGRGRPEPASPVTQAPTPPTSATAPITIAPPEALRGFGEALNGCAPERYADLPAALRTRCAKPGEGLAVKNAPNLMGEKSHVKDPAHW
jgi:hypothetical protein